MADPAEWNYGGRSSEPCAQKTDRGRDYGHRGKQNRFRGTCPLGNVAVFDSETSIPPERISYALNQRLPDDIVVIRSEEVPADWHPRYCNSKKNV